MKLPLGITTLLLSTVTFAAAAMKPTTPKNDIADRYTHAAQRQKHTLNTDTTPSRSTIADRYGTIATKRGGETTTREVKATTTPQDSDQIVDRFTQFAAMQRQYEQDRANGSVAPTTIAERYEKLAQK